MSEAESIDEAGQFAGSDVLADLADCRAFIGDRELGTGTVKITESEVNWNNADASESLTLAYPRICVHAISRDTSAFAWPCVYLLYSASSPPAEHEGDESSPCSDEEEAEMEELPPMEIRLVPSHTEQLETIYSSISECQLLYPDPEMSDSSETEEEDVQEISECPSDFFTSAEGLQHLTAEGEIVLAHLESILHIDGEPIATSQNGGETNSGQFEDAEESPSN